MAKTPMSMLKTDSLRKSRWSPQLAQSFGVIAIAVLLYSVYWVFTTGSPKGWGLGEKSRWDWLNLLGAPLLLAVFGAWLQQWQKYRDKSQEAEQILSRYIDQLSSLLIEKDILATSGSGREGARRVVRTRTLSALRQLKDDSERKGLVIRYLSETGVLSALEIDLSGADLEGASLEDIDLHGAILTGARLAKSKLVGANLAGCDLGPYNLRERVNSGANVTKLNIDISRGRITAADLSGANLSHAYLVTAILTGANLEGADLRGTVFGVNPLGGRIENGAILAGTNLRGVRWDKTTIWPELKKLEDARNVPACLKRKLGLQ